MTTGAGEALYDTAAVSKELTEPAGNDLSAELLARTITELTHLLRIQDLQAAQPFARLRELLAAAPHTQTVRAIDERIGRLDFKGALTLVGKLASELGLQLDGRERR